MSGSRKLAEVPVFDIEGPWFHLDSSKHVLVSVQFCRTGNLDLIQRSTLPLLSTMHFFLPYAACRPGKLSPNNLQRS